MIHNYNGYLTPADLDYETVSALTMNLTMYSPTTAFQFSIVDDILIESSDEYLVVALSIPSDAPVYVNLNQSRSILYLKIQDNDGGELAKTAAKN